MICSRNINFSLYFESNVNVLNTFSYALTEFQHCSYFHVCETGLLWNSITYFRVSTCWPRFNTWTKNVQIANLGAQEGERNLLIRNINYCMWTLKLGPTFIFIKNQSFVFVTYLILIIHKFNHFNSVLFYQTLIWTIWSKVLVSLLLHAVP